MAGDPRAGIPPHTHGPLLGSPPRRAAAAGPTPRVSRTSRRLLLLPGCAAVPGAARLGSPSSPGRGQSAIDRGGRAAGEGGRGQEAPPCCTGARWGEEARGREAGAKHSGHIHYYEEKIKKTERGGLLLSGNMAAWRREGALTPARAPSLSPL